MSFLRVLGKVEIRTAVAVLVVAVATGIVILIVTAAETQSMLPPSNWAILAFFYALTLGLPVALVIGAPVYALLRYRNAASWPKAIIVGVLPGLVMLNTMANESDLALWFIGCGVAVACLTHLMSMKRFPRLWHSSDEQNAL